MGSSPASSTNFKKKNNQLDKMSTDIPYEADYDFMDFMDEDEEQVDDFGVTIPKEVADAILRVRHGSMSDRVFSALSKTKADAIQFSTSLPDLRVLFFEMFGEQGSCVNIEFKNDSFADFGEDKIPLKDMCSIEETACALADAFGKDNIYMAAMNRADIFIIVDGCICNLMPCGANILYDVEKVEFFKKIIKTIKWKKDNKHKMVDYVVFDRSFRTTSLKVKKQECDIKMNYNDDIPDEKIFNWINSDESGLMVLHGEPGTGKTSYIRNLVYRTKNRFMFFDKSIFHHMTDSSLIEMLLKHRNSIIVLEDCEDLLTDRTGFGSCMTTILNLTDGILGDSLRFKFICTFNADIVDIDPAILRKGRMRLKYEFKKLDGKKAVALGKKLGVDVPEKDMALCEVYNFVEDNGKPPEKEKAKVGF